MPLVLLMPLGLHSDAPGSTHIVFAHTVNKPVKPAQLCEVLVRALLSPKAVACQQPTSKPGQPLTERLPLSILLCDDNAINQKVAAHILQLLGYQPDLAANGREALDALDRKPYDLIFMDVMMPEIDGLEATRVIRERQKAGATNYHSSIVIVAMTAQAMQGDREKCLAAGMDDYLAKPIRPKDIRAVIERWSSQSAPAAPAASVPKADVPEPVPAPKADAPAPVPAPKADVPAPVPAPKADVPAPEPAPKADVPAPEPALKADVPAPAVEEPPVEMDILNDLTDDNADSLRELVDLFFKQTTQQLELLEAAVRANKAEDVRRVAHSCAGASATLGMTRFVPLLRKLERQGASGTLTTAARVYEDTAREFKLIQNFLAAQLNSAAQQLATVHL